MLSQKIHPQARMVSNLLLAIICFLFANARFIVAQSPTEPAINNLPDAEIARRPWLLEKLNRNSEPFPRPNTPGSLPGNSTLVSDPPSLDGHAETPKAESPTGLSVLIRESANKTQNSQTAVSPVERLPLRDPLPLSEPVRASEAPKKVSTYEGILPPPKREAQPKPVSSVEKFRAMELELNPAMRDSNQSPPTNRPSHSDDPSYPDDLVTDDTFEERDHDSQENDWQENERSQPPKSNTKSLSDLEDGYDISDSLQLVDPRADASFSPLDEVSPEPIQPPQRIASLRGRPERSVGDSFSDAPIGLDEPEVSKSLVQIDYAGFPSEGIRVSASVAKLQPVMRTCLQHYFKQSEQANERSNWGMFHQIMVFGVDTKIIADRRGYSAIAWIAGNNACRGQRLLTEDRRGINVKSGVGLQGHQAQMLAVFSLCGVPSDYPLYVGTKRYSVNDVIQREMADCKSGEELTFTLIALSHYLDTEATWIGADGRKWDFERLLREELSQPVVGSACGGTHRLMGFSHAIRKRRAEGKPITGQWARAEDFINEFIEYTFTLQNRDGSMSTNWFEGAEDNGNMDRKVQTTGHIVEWLLTALPDSRLQDPRLVAAVRYLLVSLYREPNHDWQIGPKGHALRSLAMYYDRTYQSGVAWQAPSPVATESRRTSTRR